jgi:alkylmercury lyase
MTLGAELVGYKQIRVTDELCRSVQRASGMPLRQHQTLGELVSIMTAQRGICGPEDLISGERTRHEVRVDGRVLFTFCFVDALMLPFLLRGAPVEVWSTSPYLNAFPSREDYEWWAERSTQAETVALSLEEAFDLARDWTSAPVGDPEGGICRCRGLHHTSKGRSCRDG